MWTPDQARRMAADPRAFCGLIWPQMKLYAKQVETLESLVHNRETYVHAGHKLGKDRTGAIAALWFFCTRQPARVILTSSTGKHLKETMWAEIRELVNMASDAGRDMGLDVGDQRIRKPDPNRRGDYLPLDYVIGINAEAGEAFHGHHLDSSLMPRVFCLYSEASGIKDVFYEAGDSQAHVILANGNPVSSDGWFRRNCLAGNARHPMGKGLLRNVIHIDGERDSPNVQAAKAFYSKGGHGKPPTVIPGVLSYEEYLVRLSWPEHQRKTRLHGEFDMGGDEFLFPPAVLDHAQALGRKVLECSRKPDRNDNWVKLTQLKHGPKAMGVDVGRGGDFSVWTIIGKYGVVATCRKRTKNTSEVCGITLRLMDKYKIAADNVAFDSGGGGREHADRLRERGLDVLDVGFGERSNLPEEYKNMRTEMYGEAAKLMAITPRTKSMLEKPHDEWLKDWRCLSIPPDNNLLRQDLGCLPRMTDGEGRYRLPPKDRATTSTRHGGAEKTIREMLGRSPDDGDSFVLGVYAYTLMLERHEANSRPASY